MKSAIAAHSLDLGLRQNLSVAHHDVGWVLLAQGKLEEALAEFRADLAIIRDVADKDPTNKGWQRDVDVAYGMIGDALLAQGNVQEAIQNYKTRLSITDSVSWTVQARSRGYDRTTILLRIDWGRAANVSPASC
jgi:tetratricopeptide (TPR) repeat protein